MGIKLTQLPERLPENLTDLESHLCLLVRERDECIQELPDEIARLKGEKGKPKIKPSRLEPSEKASSEQPDSQDNPSEDSKAAQKRPGSEKRHKTAQLIIHETKVIPPAQEIPPGSEFKGYQDYTVQELIVRAHNTLYRLAIWQTPTGEYLRGKLPESVRSQGHFGVMLRSYLLYQYHHCHVTQPSLLEQMHEWGIDISAGQLNRILSDQQEWLSYLKTVGIEQDSHLKTATEGALLGAVLASGVSPSLGIISDGAGQFRLLEHGLCWVHAERLINKLIPFTEPQRLAVETVEDHLWQLYQDLKAYKQLTDSQQQLEKAELESRFDQIFTQTTSFETLNQVLRRLHQRKAELLKVLDRPELPLHNNASEQDIREFVTKRKISGSTRSDEGRRCRDTFASLKKTCRKLGVSFWEYLTDRVCGKNVIPPLGKLIAQRASSLGTLADSISLSLA
jgi:hypothetical protein